MIKQIIHQGTIKTRFIIVLTQGLLYSIISAIYIDQYKPQKLKQANYALKTGYVKNRTICNDLTNDHISATPKILKNQDSVGNLYINHVKKTQNKSTFSEF